MEPFVEKEQKLAAHIDKLIPEAGWMEFDFSDPKQYEYAVMMTKKFWDTEKYPGLLHNLEMKRKNSRTDAVRLKSDSNEGFQNMFKVTALGFDQNTKMIGAQGEGTVTGGYQRMTLTLLVTDEGGDIVAQGTKMDLTGDFMTVYASAVNGGTQSTNVFSQLFFSGVDSNGNAISGKTAKVPYIPSADPVITAPVPWCTQPWTPGAICIGLGRSWGDPELGKRLDYIWNEPMQDHPVGKIPFVGSVVFDAPIQAPLVEYKTISLNIWVGNASKGGAAILPPTDMKHVLSRFSIDPQNSCKLNWNLPGGTSAQNPGDPIEFSNIPWPSDMYAYFNCQIMVRLTNGKWVSASVLSTDKPDDNPKDGALMIKPISFIWHCLAEDTLVSMADGGNKRIADIVSGDRVLVDDKGDVAVVGYTLRGGHVGEVLKITTEEGNEIITTDAHVFMKSDYPAPASELKPGDILRAVDGIRHIATIEVLKNEKHMFCNLSLVMEVPTREVSTFVANKLLVGDINAQRIYKQLLKNNIEWVKQQVQEYMHTDVDSFFQDRSLK